MQKTTKQKWGVSLPPLVIMFFVLLIGMVSTNTRAADELSRCPINDIPIQIISQTTSGPITFISEADLSDSSPSISPHFHHFVTSITERIKTHLGKENICIDTSRSLIQFVKWPLTVRPNDELLAPTLPENRQAVSGCRITSPWIELVIERGDSPSVQGIVRWNQRQLIADQANLARGRNVITGLAIPLSSKELATFAEDFERAMTLGEQRNRIKDRIPPDVFWLFVHTAKIGFESYYMDVRGSIGSAQKINADNYTKLVLELIDRCINSGNETIEYQSIVDASDLVDVEQYKIEHIINGYNRKKIKNDF